MNTQAENYVKEARAKGMTDEAIKGALIGSGWNEAEVLKLFREIDSGDAMPAAPAPVRMQSVSHTTESKFGMWVAFEYAIFFVSLAVVASSLAGVLHHWVDTSLSPSRYGGYSFSDSLITGYEAALIVGFPIFAFLAAILLRAHKKNPAIGDIKVRKNLVYGALIWTFVAILIRVIGIVYGFLNGASGNGTFLHLAITLLTAGSIFIYFLIDVRKDRKLQ